MALAMHELQALLKSEGIKNFFLSPDEPKILFGAKGMNGSYQFIISLELDGEFLQFRTAQFLTCPANHPHLTEVLKVLGSENYRRRLVKFGWDARDGEIVAYADMWIKDNTLTRDQFSRIMANYLPTVDFAYSRIKTTLETGTDPREDGGIPTSIIDGLPPELQDLARKLEEMIKGKGKSSEIQEVSAV